MINYFNYFPKTVYQINDDPNLDVVVNLTTNYSIFFDTLDNSALYYEYDISESDTIEGLAYKLYGDSGYHWVLMRVNNISDINTEWPLDNRSLMLSIEEKYSLAEYADTANTSTSGIEWAMSNYHSFYKIETQQLTGSGLNLDPIVDKIEIDSDTYDSLSSSSANYNLDSGVTLNLTVNKDRKTYYEYELENNEAKRKIKILKSEFIPIIKEEFDRIMRS